MKELLQSRADKPSSRSASLPPRASSGYILSMREPNNKKPRRRWLQFSLRTFLLAVAIFAVWLGLHVRSARRQQAAVEAILQDEGRVTYDFEANATECGYPPPAESPVPRWLLSRLGLDFFHPVDSVDLLLSTSDEARERTLRHLHALSKLRSLDLSNLPSDQAVQHIAQLDRLEVLSVMDASRITDEAMLHLVRLKRLKLLAFSLAPNLTDAGIAPVASLQQLEWFAVRHAQLTNESLRVVASLPRLKSLELSMCNITDAGLAHLAGLTNLESLDLSGTQVTNEGLKLLQDLTSLKSLTLVNTRVNDASALQKALPNCTIDFAPRYKP
jgi:hypothetical protein